MTLTFCNDVESLPRTAEGWPVVASTDTGCSRQAAAMRALICKLQTVLPATQRIWRLSVGVPIRFQTAVSLHQLFGIMRRTHCEG